MAKTKTSEKGKSFEQMLARLEEIVEALESGDLTLDEAMAQYKEGAEALAKCREMLDNAEKRVEMLVKNTRGELEAQAFDAEGDEEAESPEQ